MDSMELMDLSSKTTEELRSLAANKKLDPAAVIRAQGELIARLSGDKPPSPAKPPAPRKFELPPDFKFEIGVEYLFDERQAAMDRVQDYVAELRAEKQAKALANAKSRAQSGHIPYTAAEEAAMQARMDKLNPYPTNPGPYPTNQGQKRPNYNRAQRIPKGEIRWPESKWRIAAKKEAGTLTLEELITDKPIKTPDFDWRFYEVLWEWAKNVDSSMKGKADNYLQETFTITEDEFCMLCFEPRRIQGDTLPIIKDMPEQLEVNRGNSDMNWDPQLLALQFLYNDPDLNKSDLATFKRHRCSDLLTRYHFLLTRMAALNHRIVGHKDPDFGASLFLKEIQKNIGKNHEHSKEVDRYNHEADDFLNDFEAKRKQRVQEHESKMRNKYRKTDHWFVRRLVAREERIRVKGEDRSASKRVADDWDRFDRHGSGQSAHAKRMRQE